MGIDALCYRRVVPSHAPSLSMVGATFAAKSLADSTVLLASAIVELTFFRLLDINCLSGSGSLASSVAAPR